MPKDLQILLMINKAAAQPSPRSGEGLRSEGHMAEEGVQAAQQALGDLTLAEPAPPHPPAPPTTRQRGSVRWFNASKGQPSAPPLPPHIDSVHLLACHPRAWLCYAQVFVKRLVVRFV